MEFSNNNPRLNDVLSFSKLPDEFVNFQESLIRPLKEVELRKMFKASNSDGSAISYTFELIIRSNINMELLGSGIKIQFGNGEDIDPSCRS